jgi:dolichol-phosphate mannosyltransferase
MSSFFVFKQNIPRELKFDVIGYNMLMEILVKTSGVKVKEISYVFLDRMEGSSNLTIIL